MLSAVHFDNLIIYYLFYELLFCTSELTITFRAFLLCALGLSFDQSQRYSKIPHNIEQ